jgi:predicted nucleic acid-binding protein
VTSAAKYLLDTNFVLGLLKSAPEILGMAAQRKMQAHECAYSAVTRMELLGFAGITAEEDALIRARLAHFAYRLAPPAPHQTA